MRSHIDPEMQYDLNYWVVSIISTTKDRSIESLPNLLGGHAAIVIEGLNPSSSPGFFGDNEPFIWQYGISAIPYQGAGSLNSHGVINNIKKFSTSEGENKEKGIYNNTRDYQKEQYPAKSYLVQKDDAMRMVESIENDMRRIKQGMENGSRNSDFYQDEKGRKIEPMKYQKLGMNHPWVRVFGNPEEGDNCAGWCIAKLQVAGIGDPRGKNFPKPDYAAGRCVIL